MCSCVQVVVHSNIHTPVPGTPRSLAAAVAEVPVPLLPDGTWMAASHEPTSRTGEKLADSPVIACVAEWDGHHIITLLQAYIRKLQPSGPTGQSLYGE